MANATTRAMMNDYYKQTAFLRQCLLYDDTSERHKLEESIAQLQGKERCVRRAMWLMALFGALALAGLCYAAVFLAEFPLNVSQFTMQLFVKILCATALGSLICLVSFLVLGALYRKELHHRREECRRLVSNLLESRLGNPGTVPSPGAGKERKNAASKNEAMSPRPRG